MVSKYTLSAILAVAFIATTVSAGMGKNGKLMAWGSCLTAESMKTMMETKNATMAACRAELGLALTDSAATATTGKPTEGAGQRKPNFCFMECMMKKNGLVKGGSFVLEDYAKANIKPEHQEKVKSGFNECLTKEGLTATYTVNKDDQCTSLEKHSNCLFIATKVCKANSSA